MKKRRPFRLSEFHVCVGAILFLAGALVAIACGAEPVDVACVGIALGAAVMASSL